MLTSRLNALYLYKGFIFSSIQREFQSKYQNSLLGAAWTVLNPLAMIVVYTVIFSQVMQAKLPGSAGDYAYSIYLCTGVLLWGLFAEIVTRAQNTFIDNANLLKKLSFPRICLPVIVIGNALVNFAIVFSLFTLFLGVSGNFPGVVYAGLLPVVMLLVLFAIGLGVSLGVLNVFFRDVGQFFGIVIQFWFWLTPIVYPLDILPETLRPLMHYNPMAALIMAGQDILVSGRWPVLQSLWPVTLLALLLCGLAVRLFIRYSGEMVDEL